MIERDGIFICTEISKGTDFIRHILFLPLRSQRQSRRHLFNLFRMEMWKSMGIHLTGRRGGELNAVVKCLVISHLLCSDAATGPQLWVLLMLSASSTPKPFQCNPSVLELKLLKGKPCANGHKKDSRSITPWVLTGCQCAAACKRPARLIRAKSCFQ